uniref:Uncharacterized protein n=1 Tax=Ochrobactrum phage ORM_20 TaxID=2985243 RepID=A0A9N6WU23_9VIRU|nr:hypothetical protein ORM20_00157 [Ochrobactrum phage ORM_20]
MSKYRIPVFGESAEFVSSLKTLGLSVKTKKNGEEGVIVEVAAPDQVSQYNLITFLAENHDPRVKNKNRLDLFYGAE